MSGVCKLDPVSHWWTCKSRLDGDKELTCRYLGGSWMYSTFGDQTLKWLLGNYSNLYGSKSWIEKLCSFSVWIWDCTIVRWSRRGQVSGAYEGGSDDAAGGHAGNAASYASGQSDFLEQVIYTVWSSFCLRKARVQRRDASSSAEYQQFLGVSCWIDNNSNWR